MKLSRFALCGAGLVIVVPIIAYGTDTKAPADVAPAVKAPVYEVEPPGSLYEGCRISWGKKLCGEDAQKPDIGLPNRYESKSRTDYSTEHREDDCIATPEKFARINSNLSLQTIQRIMGCDGELVNEVKIDGQRWKTLIWRGSKSGTGVVAVFNGWRTQSITQMGMGSRY